MIRDAAVHFILYDTVTVKRVKLKLQWLIDSSSCDLHKIEDQGDMVKKDLV